MKALDVTRGLSEFGLTQRRRDAENWRVSLKWMGASGTQGLQSQK